MESIRKIMENNGGICPIRRTNPYKRMMKANKEQRVVSKLLKHEFKQNISGKVLLTDITTYLEYSKNKKTHSFTIEDGSTNEILAYHVSERLTLDIATTIIIKLKKKKRI